MAGNQGTIIIKKVKKGGHAHHGGAWKVAYADFVTAMMAFFLLLWLLNATTDEQKRGIADYFTPASVSRNTSGGGGVLGGRTLSNEGVMARDRSAVNLTINLPSDQPVAEPAERDPEAKLSEEDEDQASPGVLDREQVEEMLAREKAKEEQEQLEAAKEELRQAIEGVPELQELADNLIVEQTPEGLRIQIVDQAKLSMFPLGSADMYEHTRKLMAAVVSAIKDLPQKIAIKGHTDAAPYATTNGYSNWELSADRANASRRALIEAGLPEARVESVTGRADQEPLLPEDPLSPRNRRISITLLRESAPAPMGTGNVLDVTREGAAERQAAREAQDPASLLERDE